MRTLIVAVLWTLILAYPTLAQGEEHLVIIGGGDHPPAAMAQFHEWAGLQKARILVIPWASVEPDASLETLRKDFPTLPPRAVELSPLAPLNDATRARFVRQLQEATAVWFTGGDQVKIMEVLKDKELLQLLRAKYAGGTVFGGTSAGTAIMSQRMLTGEADLTVIDGRKVEVKQGLGLLPRTVIVDQHFIKRQRENRLFGVILDNPDAVGVGIDEDTALVISGGHRARVVGPTQVMVVRAPDGKPGNALQVLLFKSGESFDLLKP